MDAKTELERKLVGLAPGMEAEIRQVLEAYRDRRRPGAP